MFRKTIIICLALIMALGLAACGHEHEWADASCLTPKTCTSCQETEGEALGHTWANATCSAPKTCTACGATEGEPLEHTWVEANYQHPKTCSVCAATEGEALVAYFTEYGLDAKLLDKSGEYDITLICYTDTTKTTVGKVIVEDYKTIASDETHEAMEGYEWRILSVKLHFADENAQKYGSNGYKYLWTDKYISGTPDGSDLDGLSTTGIVQSFVWNGVEYNDGIFRVEESTPGWQKDDAGASYLDIFMVVSVRVPVGFDGFIFGFESTNWEWAEGVYLHEVITDNTLLFCFD